MENTLHDKLTNDCNEIIVLISDFQERMKVLKEKSTTPFGRVETVVKVPDEIKDDNKSYPYFFEELTFYTSVGLNYNPAWTGTTDTESVNFVQ